MWVFSPPFLDVIKLRVYLILTRMNLPRQLIVTWQSTIWRPIRIRPTIYQSFKSIYNWCPTIVQLQHLHFSFRLWTLSNSQVDRVNNSPLNYSHETDKEWFINTVSIYLPILLFCYKFCRTSATSAMVQNISAAGVTTWEEKTFRNKKNKSLQFWFLLPYYDS